jgi:hypothetical protein
MRLFSSAPLLKTSSADAIILVPTIHRRWPESRDFCYLGDLSWFNPLPTLLVPEIPLE